MSAQESLPSTDALQQQPEPPLAKLHIPEGIAVVPNVALPANATVWTKLQLLLRAHQLAARAYWRMLLLRGVVLVIALVVAYPPAFFLGYGIFWLIYNDPHDHVQHYVNNGGFHTYYVDSKEVSQQQYDYFLLQHRGNESLALVVAIPVAVLFGLILCAIIWFLFRPRKPLVFGTVEEQIAAFAKDDPEALASWGGVAVLRVPQLIERLLDLHARDVRS